MICEICEKTKADDKRSNICKGCSLKNHYKIKHETEDYIIIEHKVGKRGKQRVYKFRSNCQECGKDKGYVFKAALDSLCGSCAVKKSNLINKKTIITNQGLRSYHDTPFQGMVCVRSSYEAFYIEYLNEKQIKFLYEPKAFIFKDKTTYTPDFYLINDDIYIELKGLKTKEYIKKKKQMDLEYPEVKVIELGLKELKKIGYLVNKYRKSFKILINNDSWTVYLEKNFNKKHKKTNIAVTNITNKKVYFRINNIDIETILHELYHVYYSYMNLGSTNSMTEDDLEEIHCEFVSKNLYKVLYQGLIIHKNLIYISKSRYKKDENFKLFGEQFQEDQIKKLISAFKFEYKSKHSIFNT